MTSTVRFIQTKLELDYPQLLVQPDLKEELMHIMDHFMTQQFNQMLLEEILELL